MTIPVYEGNAVTTGYLTTGYDLVATAPASIAAGNVLIAFLIFDADDANTITPPNGWTQITTVDVSGSAARRSISYFKVAGGSEPETYTWVRDVQGNFAWIITIARISGADTASPINVSGSQANANSTSVTAPTITTTVNNCLLVFLGSDPNGRTYTPPGGMTERWEQRYAAGAYDITQEGATEDFATAGATGTRVATVNPATDNAGHLIAIAPPVLYEGTQPETATPADTQGITVEYAVATSEVASAADGQATTGSYSVATPEAASPVDAQSTLVLFLGSVLETAAVSDTQSGPVGRILRRADGADNQFTIAETANGLRVYVANAGPDEANYVDFPIPGFKAGKQYKATVAYNGSLAAGLRVALYAKELDLESGRYLAQEAPTPAVTGTIAATLQDSALGYTFGPDSASGGPGAGSVGLCLDEVRIWYGVALTSAEADAESIYVAPVKAGCSHRWDFDGDAVDSIAALDGAVTGAIQWYDGRQPEGLTLTDVEGIGRGRYLARKTFSRAGVARYYDGVDYVTRTAPAGHLRDAHYWTANDGITYRTTLLGRAYTNLNDSDNLAAWAVGGTPVVTAGISDPLGGTGAYRIADNHAADLEYIYRATVVMTGDGIKSVSFVIREADFPTGDAHSLRVFEGTTDVYIAFADVTGFVAGKPTVSMVAGTLLGVFYVGNGYWRVDIQTIAAVAANDHVMFVIPAATGTFQGSIDVYRVNAFNDPIPPQDILDASEVRAADSFVDAYTALPQAATYLYEGVVADLPNQGTARWLFGIGDAATSMLAVLWSDAAQRLVIYFDNGVSAKSGSYFTDAVALGDHITLRIVQGADGALTAWLSVNGAAEGALDITEAAQALPATWANPRIRFGDYTSGGSPSNSTLTKFVAASGSKTTAQMQALLETDASCLYMYVPGQYTDRGTYSMWMQNTGTQATGTVLANTTAGLWQVFRSRVRELVDYVSIVTTAGGSNAADLTPGNVLTTKMHGVRETTTATRTMVAYVGITGFGYFDDMTWYQLPLATPSTATKGNSLPGLTGFGNAVGVANATIVDWDSEAPTSPDVFDAAIATSALQRVVKFDTGPSGTLKRAYRLGLSGQLNGLTPGSWYSAVVGVFIPSTAAITASHVTVKAIDTAGTTTGESADAKGVWQWLHVQRQVDAGATEAYVEVQVEDSVAFGTANAYCYLAMPTVVAGRVRCIPIPNDGEGTVAKAAETNVDAYVVPSSRELTWYLKIRENGQAYAVAEGLLSRIDGGSTAPGLRIFGGGAQRYRVEYADGTTTAQVALSPSVTMGQQVEILVSYVPTTGVVTVSVSVASGTETTGTATGGANPAAWSGAYVRKGPGGAFDWIDEKIALGSHDMAAMRAAS